MICVMTGKSCDMDCLDPCHFVDNLPKPTPQQETSPTSECSNAVKQDGGGGSGNCSPTLEQLAENIGACLEMYLRTMLRNPRDFDEDQAKEWPTAKVLAKYELDRALAEFHKAAQEYAFSR